MKRAIIWSIWLTLSLLLSLFFGTKLFGEGDKSVFLIGPSTYGHYQIEMACTTCHSEPFGGTEVLQEACTQCHAQDLRESRDTHPRSKFTDPRNADRLALVEARYCITCHTEHRRDQTRAMGATLPVDFCYHCHADIGEERPSHAQLGFETCASAGCHNYHDNLALTEDFLVRHGQQPWLKDIAQIISGDLSPATQVLERRESAHPGNSAYPELLAQHPEITEQWQHTSHAQAGVDCGGCHADSAGQWLERPDHQACRSCHSEEVQGFLSGRHGMRLADEVTPPLSPMTPALSHLPFNVDALHREQTCNACHGAHEFNTRNAAVYACLDCHDDQHSQAFLASPHGQLWQDSALTPENADPVVTCASCHMPRVERQLQGQTVGVVQHNQNWNLRPNEKMIRSVCMGCHSVDFTINALADPILIANNFAHQPGEKIPSLDWALKHRRSNVTHTPNDSPNQAP